jgi:hypothetical protein
MQYGMASNSRMHAAIHNGLVTHRHDQARILVSFNIVNISVKNVTKTALAMMGLDWFMY